MLSKEQWEEFEKRLSHPYGAVNLVCDGYDVTFSVERASETAIKYAILWYIGGKFKGKWIFEDCEIRRKFARASRRSMWKRGRWKGFSKKDLKKIGIDPDGKITVYLWPWNSAKSLRRHLIKNCQSIELVRENV